MLFIFDLDGTLIDSSVDLAIAMNATRQYAGLSPLDPTLIYSFVGNGAAKLVRRALPADASEDSIKDCLQFFLEFYAAHALENTVLYPNVQSVIEHLHKAGHTLAVLTNKPIAITWEILLALGLGQTFAAVYGGDSFAVKKPDPVGIFNVMKDTGMSAAETVMVGDSYVDVQTARNAEVMSCGVGWGFQPESLKACPPDVLISDPWQLLELKQASLI